MDEPIQQLINRARQRHLTIEEIAAVENSARRATLGTEAVERLTVREVPLIGAAVHAAEKAFPQLESEMPGSLDLIRHTATLVLRHVGFAAALDDPEHLCRALRELQPVHSDAALGGDVIRCVFDALHDAAMGELSAPQRPIVERWLATASRFLEVTSEIALFREEVLQRFAAASNQPSATDRASVKDGAFSSADFAGILDAAVLEILPEGPRHRFDALRALYDKLRQERGAGVSAETWATFAQTCKATLDGTAAETALPSIETACRFLAAATDLTTRIDGIVRSSVDGLCARYPDCCADDEFRARTERDEALILEHALFGSIGGGEASLIEMAGDFWLMLQKFNFGGKFITEAYGLLLGVCRERLPPDTQAFLLPVLTNTCTFVALGAQLAEKQSAMLTEVGDALVRNHTEYFLGESIARAYVMRDQEQLLFNLALDLLPGAEVITAGRFTIFAETLTSRAFPAKLMIDSFARLEDACRKTLEPATFASIEARWRRLRSRFESCVAAAPRTRTQPSTASATAA